MSEIPVGSPPVPPGRHAAPGGWYADPAKDGQERYWDGWQWTRNVRPAEDKIAPNRNASGNRAGQGAPWQGAQGQGQAQGNSAQGPGMPGNSHQPGQPQQGQLAYVGGKVVPADQVGRPLGNRGLRVLAKIIDLILITTLGWAACFPIAITFFERYMAYYRVAYEAASQGQPMPPTPPANELISAGDQSTLTLVTALVSFVFVLVFLRWKAATPGKLITGLRVVPKDSDTALSTSHLVKRSLAEAACSVFFPLQLLDYLFPLWDRGRQALHDKLALTQVVSKSAAPQPPQQSASQPPHQQAHQQPPAAWPPNDGQPRQ